MFLKLKKFILLLFTFLVTIISIGTAQQLQKIIPPSPNIATMQRFGDYPVNHSTGLVDIKIPLYSIGLKSFSFPIDINFHASGRRGTLTFSPLGVGWALNATGYVSREIRDRPDDQNYIKYGMTRSDVLGITGNLSNDYLQTYYRLLACDIAIPNGAGDEQSKIDTERDIYSYNVNGISGKFFFNWDGSLVELTQSPYKITGTPAGPFTITDEQGNAYEFNGTAKEYTSSTYNNSTISLTTGWFLKRIVTPNGENVNFEYDSRITDFADDNLFGSTGTFKQVTNGIDLSVTLANRSAELSNLLSQSGSWRHSFIQATGNNTMVFLKTITFPDGKVTFDYDSYNYSLKTCHIKSPSDAVLKEIAFEYRTTPGTLTTLANNNSISLDYLTFKDASSTEIQKYSFDYYDYTLNTTAPNVAYLFPYSTDWWGYCNQNGNNGPVDLVMDPGGQTGCTDCKEASFNHKVSGMLKKIIYPTGGYTEFVYEANRYKHNTVTPTNGPGLRIGQIISDDGSGINKITKTYKYGEDEDGFGKLLYQPSFEDFKKVEYFVTALYPATWGGTFELRTFTPFPVSTMAEAYQQPLYYRVVSEYTSSADGFNGKTIFSYSTPTGILTSDNPKSFRLRHWESSKLIFKATYAYNVAWMPNPYKLIEEQSYHYEKLSDTLIPQFRITRNYFVKSEDNGLVGQRNLERKVEFGSQPNASPVDLFSVKDYPIESGVEKLTYETNRKYNPDNTFIETRKDYRYANLNHLQPTWVGTTTSVSSDTLITETKYAQDFLVTIPTGNLATAIVNLKSEHILAPIEVSEFKSFNGTKKLISSALSAYHPTKPVIDSILTIETTSPILVFTPARIVSNKLVADNRYSKKLAFDEYDDKSNLLQQHLSGDLNTTYLWSYNGQFPIAEIKNVSYATVEAILGKAVIESFRDRPSPGDTEVNGFLAPLRTHANLANALITTYTYRPQIGMTSSTDPRGMVTYYEYDAFQRLRNIRDHHRNILKSYCYNYAGQQTGCPIMYESALKSGVFYKACTSGVGSKVTYVVPLGTYSAKTQLEADALAQADVDANGPSYANTNGNCDGKPHVKLFLTNISTSGNNTYYNYSFRAFIDSACTLAYTVPTTLTVQYWKQTTTITNGTPTITDTYHSTTILAGTNARNFTNVLSSTCATQPGGGNALMGTDSTTVTATVTAQQESSATIGGGATTNGNTPPPGGGGGNQNCEYSSWILRPGTGYNIQGSQGSGGGPGGGGLID